MDINTLPRLEKEINFDPRFETDWQFILVRKVFYAMGDARFSEFLKQWVKLVHHSVCPLDSAMLWKLEHLLPRTNQNAYKHLNDAVLLIRLITAYFQDNFGKGITTATRKILPGEALLIFNEIDTSHELEYSIDNDNLKLIYHVFIDLVHLFYMLQAIEIGAFSPKDLILPPKIYRNGKLETYYPVAEN